MHASFSNPVLRLTSTKARSMSSNGNPERRGPLMRSVWRWCCRADQQRASSRDDDADVEDKKKERRELYKLLAALGVGQFASLLITSTGLTSSLLAREGIDAPTSQSLCNYVLLTVFYGCIFLRTKKRMQVSWYFYLILALMDVEGNYLVVKAYQYTSLTSVMLLDCWTIPCVLILTWIFIKTKYKLGHLIGVCMCVLGLVLVVLSDVHANDRTGGSRPVLGDMLVILGSTLYAATNVSEEFLIKEVNFVELLAFLGLFGALISACQVAILEREELKSIVWTHNAVLPFVGYAVSLFLFYSLVPIILKLSGSALLNLSLLTSDMWAVAIRIFAYHQEVDWLFYVAFATVAIGLVIYSVSGKKRDTHVSKKDVVAEDTLYIPIETMTDEPVTELQVETPGVSSDKPTSDSPSSTSISASGNAPEIH